MSAHSSLKWGTEHVQHASAQAALGQEENAV
jgi:hypothetical protein